MNVHTQKPAFQSKRSFWLFLLFCIGFSSSNTINAALAPNPPTITCPENNLDLPAGCNVSPPPPATDYNDGGRPDPTFPTVSDGCEPLVLTSYQDTIDVGCMRTITRSYVITDANMDADTCMQTFTFVFDTLSPIFIVPTDTLINHDQNVNDLAVTGDVSDTLDACGTDLLVTVNNINNLTGCNNTGTIMRTFTVTDACGNSSVQTQTITVQDTVPPTITCPENNLDLPAGCNVSPPPPATDYNDGGRPDPTFPTVSDGCGTLTLTSYQDTTDVGCMRTITRSYIITDENMNADTCMQTFTFVFDTIPPELTPLPMDTLVDCNAIPAAPLVSAVDTCGPAAPAVMFMETMVAGTCQGESTITRTWTATDDCGNGFTHTQIIMVQDTTPPTFTAPMDTVINCGEDVNDLTVTGDVTDTLDACGTGLTVSVNDIADLTACNNTGTITREFTVTDSCGNSSIQTQIITVQDTVPPTFTAPADTLINCGQDINDLAVTGDVRDTMDACGTGLTVTVNDITNLTTCNNTGTLSREFTVTDACGNSSVQTQIITVQDTLPPIFTAPADTLINCGQDINDLAVTGDVRDTMDACGTGLTVTVNDITNLTTCNNTGTLSREFTVTDACGNSSVQTQIITVQDTLSPTFTAPADTLINCGQDISDLAVTGDVTDTMDACGTGLTVSVNDITNLTACNNTGTLSREFTVTDACGNSSVQTQMITVQDTLPPTFTAPADTIINCGQDFSDLAVTGDISDTMDACGTGLTVTLNDIDDLTACNNTGTITREFTVTDSCGNSSVQTQVITVQDTLSPMMVCMDITVELDANGMASILPANIDNGSDDNCGDVVLSIDVMDFTCADIGAAVVVTLTGEDGCGLTNTCTSNVTVLDLLPPLMNCPQDLTINLDPGACDVIYSYDVTATDNCDADPVIAQTSGLPSGALFEKDSTYVFEYTATDASGNVMTCSWELTVEEYPFPTNSMTCNQSGVQISLDPNCEAIIGADDILEGGPYGCYDDFIVKLFFDEQMNNPVPTSPMVTGANIGQTIYVSICDENGNSCWGLALIEDKLAPMLDCTSYDILCDESIDPIAGGIPGFPVPASANVFQTNAQLGTNQYTVANFDPCDNAAILGYSDWIDDIDCLVDPGNPYSQIIYRTWTFTDEYGNSSQCEDTLNIIRAMISDIALPPNYDDFAEPALQCDEKEPTPANSSCGPVLGWNAIDSGVDAGNPSPYDELYPCGNVKWFGTGIPQASGCGNIKATFTDIRINVCQDGNSDGCFNILRKWILIDACTNDVVNHTQRIKIADDEGPTITDIVDATISVAAWGCEATYYVPEPWIMDNCSDIDGMYTVTATKGKIGFLPNIGRYVITELPLGVFQLKVRSVDCCGNVTEVEVDISVEDLVPPYVTCEVYKTTSVSITGDASIMASSFDDGSYDACGPVYFKVIRMEDLLGTDPGSQANQSATDCDLINGDDNPTRFGNQIYFDDYVKFCCEDIGATDLQVKLRVFDRDPGAGPIKPIRMRPGGDLYGHFNDCWSNVSVVDYLAPTISCPDDITVACDFWFDMNDLNSTFGTVVDDINDVNYIIINGMNVGSDGLAGDNCSVTITENVVDNLDCGQGVITRIFTATDPDGRTASCVQRITIEDNDPYFINDDNCFNTDPNDGVRWPCNYNGSVCGQDTDPSVSGEPQIFNEDNCSQVVVTKVDEEFHVVPDACFKIKRIWTVTDWCNFDEFDSDNNDVYDATDDGIIAGQWEYVQFVKILNLAEPVFETCTDLDICGYNANCTGTAALSNRVGDDCTPEDLLVVDFKIDLDNDGIYDFIGANVNPYPYPNPNGLPILAVTYTDAGSGLYEMTISSIDYPIGTHRILWSAEDKCSNVGTCQYLFNVQDCAKPTPKAFHGLAVDVQPVTQQVVVTAMMMDAGSFDNCCLAANPFRIATPSGGQNQTSPPSTTEVVFDCTQLGTQSIDFWVQDCNGNWDYVISYVNVQNNMGACPTPNLNIAGTIENEIGASVAEVEVSLSGNATNMPASQITTTSGAYVFEDLELNSNYQVTPEKDINYRNGISTLDMVLISRHLIGLQPLDSPYKLIAADVDNSEHVSALDMIALQRLILYIDTVFADNTSWRFVEATHVFTNPSNPWTSSFPEVFAVNGLLTDELADFIGIKIGDVNGNANPAGIAAPANDRSFQGTVDFELENISMKAGEEYTAIFKVSSKTLSQIRGYQFTLNFDVDAVEILDVKAGSIDADFGLSMIEEGVITSNWSSAEATRLENDVVAFTVNLKVNAEALGITQLKEVISLNSRYTNAEAYNQDLELMNVGLNFYSNESDQTLSHSEAWGFDLYQNQPNPFKEETLIGFHLPEAGMARLSIYDVSGKVLKSIEGDYAKGYNEVSIMRSDLAASGVLYYQLDTEKDAATRKMIIIE